MNEQERIRQIQRLQNPDTWEKVEAAWALARSGDAIAVAAVLELLSDPKSYHSEVVQSAIDGLIDGASQTIPFVLPVLERAPLSPAGDACIYVLGEIAYKQEGNRDPRIVPGLLRALTIVLPNGTRAAATTLASLRECTRVGPVPEADAILEYVLVQAMKEVDPYLPSLDNTLEVLYASRGMPFLNEIRSLLVALPPGSGLADAITYFLASH